MAFCPSCGTEHPDDYNFCSTCGTPRNGAGVNPIQPKRMEPFYRNVDRTKYLVKAGISFALMIFCMGLNLIPTIVMIVYLIIAETSVHQYPTAEENPNYKLVNLWANISFWIAGGQVVLIILFFVAMAVLSQ